MSKKEKNQKLNNAKSTKRKRQIALFKFFAIFIGVIAVYYIAILALNDSFFDAYVNATASIAGKLVNFADNSVRVKDSLLAGDKFIIDIRFGCEGSEPIILLLAGILAFPANWKNKLIGALSGGLIIYFLNLFRIMALYFIGINNPNNFELFHVTVFPIVFIIISLSIWFLWIKMAGRK